MLKDLLDRDELGLTVYMPDSSRSHLWGNLDQFIHQKTGFQPVARQIFNQDYNSLSCFYNVPAAIERPLSIEDYLRKLATVPVADLEFGHLFTKMQITGPSLLTLWKGSQAIDVLLKLKGIAHPAKAERGTIRSGFWCDSPVCNLVHSSDNNQDLVRELQAISLVELLNQPEQSINLAQPREYPLDSIAHCGISLVTKLVDRDSKTQLPLSGDSFQTVNTCLKILKATAPTELAIGFLKGDLSLVSNALDSLSVNDWDRLVILASTLSRKEWIEQGL